MLSVSYFAVDEAAVGERLDVFLTREAGDLSRSRIQKLINEGMVTVNGHFSRPGYRLKKGDEIVLKVPPPEELQVLPEPIPLDVYYEDSDVIVVNKPRGMVVHPAPGHNSGTLVNALLHHCRDLSGIGGVIRPGIVHRLDKDTSGLLVVAKSDLAHLELARQLKLRQVNRKYIALVHGDVRHDKGTVNAPIGRHPRDRQKMAVVPDGREAITYYRVLQRWGNYTLLELRLATGRTHQIRVHMAYLGYPLVGDLKYGPARPHFALAGQFLHAMLLGFRHPRSGNYLEFTAPLPAELQDVLNKLGVKDGLIPYPG